MSRSVSFVNPAYSPVQDDNQPSPVANDNSHKILSGDESEEESDGFEDDAISLDPLDINSLNPYKFDNDTMLYRIGPAPIAENPDFISSSKRVAILSKNADGVKFDELRKVLQSEGYEKVADMSRSACDALLSYFYEQGNQGQNAQIDYHFLDNMLTGEGGKALLVKVY